MYQIFTATPTSQQLIQFGEEVLDWYKNPQVTNDSDMVYQLDTVYSLWKAELPADGDGDEGFLHTIRSLRVRIAAAASSVRHEE